MGDCCLYRDLWGRSIIGLNLQFKIAERCRNKWMLGLRASFPGTSHCLRGTQSSKGNVVNLDETFTVILTGGWFNPCRVWRIFIGANGLNWTVNIAVVLYWPHPCMWSCRPGKWQCRQEIPEAPQCQLSPWNWGWIWSVVGWGAASKDRNAVSWMLPYLMAR